MSLENKIGSRLRHHIIAAMRNQKQSLRSANARITKRAECTVNLVLEPSQDAEGVCRRWIYHFWQVIIERTIIIFECRIEYDVCIENCLYIKSQREGTWKGFACSIVSFKWKGRSYPISLCYYIFWPKSMFHILTKANIKLVLLNLNSYFHRCKELNSTLTVEDHYESFLILVKSRCWRRWSMPVWYFKLRDQMSQIAKEQQLTVIVGV